MKPTGHSSLRRRFVLLLLGVTALAVLSIGLLAVTGIQQEVRTVQGISGSALRDQAQQYLIQLTERGARENDQTLEKIRDTALELAQTTANIYGNSRSLTNEDFWPAADHMFFGSDGQYMNGEEDVSSVFVPIGQEIDFQVIQDIELTAYLDHIFPATYESDPNTVALYIGTPRDVVRYYPNIQLGAVVPPDFRVTQRPWYVSSTTDNPEGEPVWAPVYLDATGRGFVTTASAPVFNQQRQLIGVIGVDVTLEGMTAYVESTPILDSGYSFLIDGAGTAIALPDQGYIDLLGRERGEEEFGTDLSESRGEFSPILGRMMAGETGFDSVTIGGNELFVAYAPLESSGWSLGSVVPASQVLQSVGLIENRMLNSTRELVLFRILPASIAVFLVMALVGILLTNRLIKPLERITTAAEQIGSGQLDVELPTERRDEIGTLAIAFQKMTDQLSELISGLERKVNERTQALERQTAQLQATTDIAHLSAALLEPHALLNQSAELIREQFGYYHASIFTLDETGSWMNLAASTGDAGKELLARSHRLAIGSASIVGWVAENREPRVANDVEADPFHFKNPLLPNTRAELAVPVVLGNRLLGVLDVQSTAAFSFSEQDVRSLQAIADEIAIALENVRLVGEREAVLQRSEGEYRRLTRASWSHILSDGLRSTLQLPSAFPDQDIHQEDFLTLTPATQDGETTLSTDRREISVPVSVRGEVIATIAARKPSPGQEWMEDEIALLEAVAVQTGLALETARQYSEEQRRVIELEVLNRVSQAASQLLPPATLFRVVYSQISLVIGQSDTLVALYDERLNELSFPFAMRGDVPYDLPSMELGEDLISTIIQSRQPILIGEGVTTPILGDSARGWEIHPQSWLGVPLIAGQDILGVLALQDNRQPDRFDEEDVALLSTIASQVATALQNSQLMSQIQRSARQERLIHEIASKVRRSPDIRSVLDTAAREIGRAFNASSATIKLQGDEEVSGEGGFPQSGDNPAASASGSSEQP